MSNSKKLNENPSLDSITGTPDNSIEYVNRYGTYEIQATCNTENEYPLIAQGYNKKLLKSDGENKKTKI